MSGDLDSIGRARVPRLDRVDEEALAERQKHVDKVRNDEHLRLLESRLWGTPNV